jgi:alpha-L-fucosidase
MQPFGDQRDWFTQKRFGLFLHFGLYAIEGWHEQDQMRRRIPRAQYAQLLPRLNPHAFDAEALLDLAQAAGMEYVCMTAKHHDGFCLWNTAQTDFNVMHTPCRRDLIAELAAACHKRNFSLGFYYSVADWHHPNYPNQGRHHELPGPEAGDAPDWDKYMEFIKAQVRELCTRYGTVHHFFWDINVPEHQDPSINAMLRALQPRMVINDRGFDKGDFGTPEREQQLPGIDPRAAFQRPTEACNSVGTQSWGYRRDEDYYTPSHLIRSMARIMAKGGNYLLNVGPDAEGRVPEKAAAVLSEIGRWHHAVAEAFRDTTPASELTTNGDVLLTRKNNTLYVHLVEPPKSDAVILAPLAQKPVRATLLNTGKPVQTEVTLLPVYWQAAQPCLILRQLPVAALANETLVVRLEFDAPPEAGMAGTAFVG